MAMLALEDYQRYGRQMILDDFGLPGKSYWSLYVLFHVYLLSQGQLKLHRAAVAVVGAGGLGCPALQYLGASGIGTEDERLSHPSAIFYFI